MRWMFFTALAVVIVGLLVFWPGPRRHDIFAQDKPGKSGASVLIAGSIKADKRSGNPGKATIEGKGFRAEWHLWPDVKEKGEPLPEHWHVTFDKALGETPIVVATPYDDDVISITLIQTNKMGFRVAGKNYQTGFGFTFIVVQR